MGPITNRKFHSATISFARRFNTMPIQAPSWTEYLNCPICFHEFEATYRAPITLACGHTTCKNCLATLHRKQCPFDQANITKDLDNLPINYALLQLVPSSSSNIVDREISPSIVQALSEQELHCYKEATRCIEELALYLKPSGNISTLLSRPMQRKLVTLINCQLMEDEGRSRSLRAARSLGERTVTELILQHQNPQLLSTHLWAAVRARGCQFLGPAMQEEVLKLVLLTLEDGSPLSRKVLVLYVVSQLVSTFPQASKTSIGHVVQLLYRASCFKVSKRESDSSLMTLKEEFRTYEALRREHDTQIVQIATEAGLRIAPDQWSALLYADNDHKSHMQSIIDKLQNPSSFAMSVNELVLALQRTGDPANLSRLRNHMDNLANIDPSPEPNVIPTWQECANALESVKQVVNGLVVYIQNYGNRKSQENSSYLQNTSRYKVSFCRELQNRGTCARGQNCNFAHSDEELERYRAKFKKNSIRNATSSHHKEGSYNNTSNGPNQKVNMNNHSTFAKNQDGNSTSRFNKSMPYRNRSENSLHHTPMTPHHLKPTNVYSNSSSTSTPNLSLQLSPNQQKINSPNGATVPRFAFNVNNGSMHHTYGMNYLDSSHHHMPPSAAPTKFMNHRPPLSAPPIPQQPNNYGKSAPSSSSSTSDYKKQLSPYHHGHNNNNNNNVPTMMSSPTHVQSQYTSPKTPNSNSSSSYYGMSAPSSHFFGNNNHNPRNSIDECNTSSSSSASYGEQKYLSWNKQQKSPNHLMPKSPTMSQHFSKSANASPNSRFDVQDFKRNINANRMSIPPQPPTNLYQQQQPKGDEVDGIGNLWNYPQFNFPPPPPPLTQQQQQSPQQIMKPIGFQYNPNSTNNTGKDKFIRSDSILTSNTDDSFDNLPTNGKYGAIGLKTNDNINASKANQWSGLQQTISKGFANFDLSSSDGGLNDINLACASSKNNDDPHINLRTVESTNPNVQGLNESFLNMTIRDMPSTSSNLSNDFWTNKTMPKWNNNNNNNNNNNASNNNESKKDYDMDSLGNDVWGPNIWDFISN